MIHHHNLYQTQIEQISTQPTFPQSSTHKSQRGIKNRKDDELKTTSYLPTQLLTLLVTLSNYLKPSKTITSQKTHITASTSTSSIQYCVQHHKIFATTPTNIYQHTKRIEKRIRKNHTQSEIRNMP